MALFRSLITWIALRHGRCENLFRLSKPSHWDYAEFLRRHKGVEIGEGTTVNSKADFMDAGRVKIGRNCSISIASFVTHSGGDRIFALECGFTLPVDSCADRRIVIEDNCAVGTGAIIGPGVTIGRGSVIGFGAVVRKSVPPGSVVVGNPGVVICGRDALKASVLRRFAGPPPVCEWDGEVLPAMYRSRADAEGAL